MVVDVCMHSLNIISMNGYNPAATATRNQVHQEQCRTPYGGPVVAVLWTEVLARADIFNQTSVLMLRS